MSTRKVKIKKVIPIENDSHSPVLLNFQNGFLNEDNLSQVKYFEGINKGTKEKSAALQVSNGGLYIGVINSVDKNNLTDNYIVIRNKTKNKARIIQINEASLVNNIYNKEIENSSLNEMNETLRREMLLKKFGGRKLLAAVDRKERMQAEIDVKEQLNSTIHTIEKSTEENLDETQIKFDIDSIAPKMNLDAKRVEDVYSITDLISPKLLSKLNEECNAILNNNIEEIPIESNFLKEILNKVKNSKCPTSEENFNIVKVCIYMDALANLIKTRQRNMNKMELSKITEKVENDIRENFSDPNLKIRTKSSLSTNKALCYYIAMALFIGENHSVNMSVLVNDLKLQKRKLSKYVRMVNGKIKIGSDIITLELPGQLKASTAKPRKILNKTM